MARCAFVSFGLPIFIDPFAMASAPFLSSSSKNFVMIMLNQVLADL